MQRFFKEPEDYKDTHTWTSKSIKLYYNYARKVYSYPYA